MKISRLRSIKPFFFSMREVQQALGISERSARVSCSRYVKSGLLIRPARNVYCLQERWPYAGWHEFAALANRLQVPSYISFTSALIRYDLTTQVQRNTYESVAITRTKLVQCMGTQFQFMKMKRELYNGFVKKEGVFIATAEKALLDSIYLMSLGLYRLDVSSLEVGRFEKKMLKKLSRPFPSATKELLREICRI